MYLITDNTSVKKFFNKIMPVPYSGCWEWMGMLSGPKSRQYGYHWIDGKNVRAHRLSYQIHKGLIDKGLFVCHNCDNRLCVNPDHLFLGTHQENISDMVSKNRGARGEKGGRSKLDATQVLTISSFINNELRRVDIARYFNISESQVRVIQYKLQWRHLFNQKN